jgi:hypothetical protein
MIEIAELLSDPDFVQQIPVTRIAGYYSSDADTMGNWMPTEQSLLVTASVQPIKNPDQLNVLPEGQRTGNFVRVYTATPLYATDDDSREDGQIIDFITWRGSQYKIIYRKDYLDYGYCMCIGVASGRATS